MQVISDQQKVNIIVAEDQLSLAIGRYGQNVRLAGKLVGWDLDIYSAKQWEEKNAEESEETEEASENASAEVKPEEAQETQPQVDAETQDDIEEEEA